MTLAEAGRAVDAFVAQHVSCRTCAFYLPSFLGPMCVYSESEYSEAPELLGTASSYCEGHSFSDRRLKEEQERLTGEWAAVFLAKGLR